MKSVQEKEKNVKWIIVEKTIIQKCMGQDSGISHCFQLLRGGGQNNFFQFFFRICNSNIILGCFSKGQDFLINFALFEKNPVLNTKTVISLLFFNQLG